MGSTLFNAASSANAPKLVWLRAPCFIRELVTVKKKWRLCELHIRFQDNENKRSGRYVIEFLA